MTAPIVILRSREPGEPTLAQKEAGNYRKRKLRWRGLTISVENEAGTFRRGRASDGTEWARMLPWSYGYVNGSMGVDGDQVDVFLGAGLEDATMVYVVHQRRYGDWDAYDEDKCMLGFDSEESARQAFLACYDDPRFLGPITAMPVDEFIAKVRATKAAPAMIKSAVMLLKGYVAPYLRDGQIVRGYHGRSAKPRPAEQVDLFAAGGDPRRDALEALRSRVTRFASGLSRVKDFSVTAWAGHPVGVEIGELSDEALERLAEQVVDHKIQVFVDSGAFGVFMRGLKREDVEDGATVQGLNFDTILDKYDRLLVLIAEKNDATQRDGFDRDEEPSDPREAYARYEDDRMGRGAQETLPPPLLVMPDVVGDQIASLNLIARYSDYVRSIASNRRIARPIIPIQRGPLSMAEAYRRLVGILGTDDFIVGVPSNAAAITPEEFTAFLQEAKPRAVHILGALADSRLNPRLNSILNSGLAGQIEVSADANPLRSIIIEKGQTPAERRERLADRLGVRARRAELDAMVERAGGLDAVRSAYTAASPDARARMLGLLGDLTGDDEDRVIREFGLSVP